MPLLAVDPALRSEIDARVGRTLNERYTLEAVIGIGRTGAVYRGTHRNGNRVAIKVLHTERAAAKATRDAFLNDAKVANRVEHAGAVRILDDDTTADGTVFVVMDLLEGQTFETLVARHGGGLSENELVPLVTQLLDVLAAAHGKGVVHGAIGPAKLFVTELRALHVLDFGTAQAVADYAAPEQARGETALVDAQTDLWAVGAVMFRALGGRTVYEAETPEMVKVQSATQPAPLLASTVTGVAPELAAIVDRALAWKKADRWSNAGAMATALRTPRKATPSEAPPVFTSSPPGPFGPPTAVEAPGPFGPPTTTAGPFGPSPVASSPPGPFGPSPVASSPPGPFGPSPVASSPPGPFGPPLAASPPGPFGPPTTAAGGTHLSAVAPTVIGAAAPVATVFGAPASPSAQTQAPSMHAPAQAPFSNYGAPPPVFIPPSTDNGWIKWVVGAAALVVFLLVGATVAGALLFRSKARARAATVAAEAAAANWSDAESPVPVSAKDPMWGMRDAPVTIVVFSDFQCPFCARSETTLSEVKTTYGPQQVRLIWKNEPLSFHVNAKPAAHAAQVVFTLGGSDAFYKFHDLAFKNQQQLTAENFRTWAIASGVDGVAYDKGLDAPAVDKKLDDDHAIAKMVGVSGTPGFRINGLELSGAQPLDKFKSMIDGELTKAAAKVASGTPKNKVYVALSTENYAQPKTTPKPSEPVEDTTTVWRVPVTGSPVRGNVDAPVTIVEFSDFQDPFSKRVESTVDKVRDTYGDKVRLVWKNMPLSYHTRAEPAAELALEARAEKSDAGFWRAHDQLFDLQPRLEDDDLLKLGAQLSLDATKLRTALRDKKHKKEIDADSDLADDVSASGSPNFFINGRKLVGAQPFEKFKAIIDDELTKFDAQKSIVAKDYYASVIKDGKTNAAALEKKIAPAVPKGAPFRGGKDAKVVIQEWADFQCPFCGRAEPTLKEILALYGDKVKIVWHDKPLPFHADAPLAAEAAREALEQKGQVGFWSMHDVLFANQQHLKRDDLEGYAAHEGLDIKKLARSLDAHSHKAAVDADDKAGTELSISGTPSFLINDYYLSGAQPLVKFRKLIDRAMAEAH